MFDKFVNRHIGCSNADTLKAMLDTIGVRSVDELLSQVIPSDIRLNAPLALSEAMSEYEYAAHIAALAAKNRTLRSFIGMGYYSKFMEDVKVTEEDIAKHYTDNAKEYTDNKIALKDEAYCVSVRHILIQPVTKDADGNTIDCAYAL